MDKSDLRVLVVDDADDAVIATVKFLEILGYQARGAFSGAAALEEAAAWQPNVAVLDLGLPDMDGFSLLERLREAAGTRPLTFIGVSGRCDDDARQRANALGMVEFLVKPVAPEDLVASIVATCAWRNDDERAPEPTRFLEATTTGKGPGGLRSDG